MKKTMFTLLALALVSGAEAQTKLTPSLWQYTHQQETVQQSRRAGSQQEQTVDCVISFSAPCKEELVALGVKPQAEMSSFMTAQVPLSVMDQVAQLEQVTSVSINQQPVLFSDAARKSTGVDKLRQGKSINLPLDYNGENVIICVIDQGIDFQHPMLRTADGHSRCSRVYLAGRKYVPGMGGEPLVVSGNQLDEGVLYTKQSEIDTLSVDTQYGSHGTHTVSTAAGRDVDEYGGVAPGAELIVCSEYGGSRNSTINAMKMAAEYAKSKGKRLIVSRSMGTLIGPHDGTSAQSKTDSELAKTDNVIICQSSANSGEDNVYIHFTKDSLKTINIGGQERKYYALMAAPYRRVTAENAAVRMAADLYCNDDQPFDLAFVTYQSNGYGLVVHDFLKYEDYEIVVKGQRLAYAKYVISNTLGEHLDSLEAYAAVNAENNKFNLTLVWNLTTDMDKTYLDKCIYMGVMIFPRNENQEAHFWLNNTNCFMLNQARDIIPAMNPNGIRLMCGNSLISCCDGATSPDVISVGNYTSKSEYTTLDGYLRKVTDIIGVDHIDMSTSYGTALNGVVVPTVCGPGSTIIAAVNHLDPAYSTTATVTKMLTVNDVNYYWAPMEGTSMSCPHVAGIMALWLQAKNDLTVQDIMTVLEKTSKPWTGDAAEKEHWGKYGRIDALAGLKYILETSDIRDLQAERALDTKGNVYNMNGQLVRSNVIPSEGVNGLPAGIYVVNGRKVVVK